MQSLRDIGAPFRKESQDESDWNKVEFSKQKDSEPAKGNCSSYQVVLVMLKTDVSQLDMYVRMRCRRVS